MDTTMRYLQEDTYSHDQDPLNEGQAETGDGAITARCWGGQAEGQEETDPVEEESHWGGGGGGVGQT